MKQNKKLPKLQDKFCLAIQTGSFGLVHEKASLASSITNLSKSQGTLNRFSLLRVLPKNGQVLKAFPNN